jgi:hypothetical protein
MPLIIDNSQYCKTFIDKSEYCLGFVDGHKIFGCRGVVTVSDNSATLNNKTYAFKEVDLTKDFSTDPGYTYNKVYIESTPEVEMLKLLGANASVGDTLKATNSSSLKFELKDRYAVYGGKLYDFSKSIDQIISEYEALGYKLVDNSNGVLTFEVPGDPSDSVTVQGKLTPNSKLCFNFRVSDNSVEEILSNIASFCLVPQGDINIKPTYVNNPPTVGDNSVTMKRGEIWVFKREDFIDNTDPRFSDPEGDQPYKFRVDTLPTTGTLKLRGVAMTVGQVIDFVDDIDAQAFTFTPDTSQTVPGVSFKFSVSDTGSKQFG